MEGKGSEAKMAPEEVDKLINFGKMALEQGWYDQAREHFEQALALDPSNREAMKGLARVNELLSRKEATAAEPIRGEPVEPLRRTAQSIPEKRSEGQRGSPVQWFKSQSRLGKIAILASMALLFCCLCVSLAIPAMFISLWNPFTPPTQPTVKIVPTPTPVEFIPRRTEPSPVGTAEATTGDFIIYSDIQTTVIEYEFADSYPTSYGAGKAAEGAKFLWLHVRSENVGEVAQDLPNPSQFVLLYKDTKINRKLLLWEDPQGYTRYQGKKVYPGIGREGWILYEIPVGASPDEIMLRFTTGKEYHIWRLEAE